jgi:hypothetical protein
MATAVRLDGNADTTELPNILRGSAILGVIQAVCVFAVSVINKALEGTADAALTGVVVLVGAALTIVLPGLWTKARTIEGISGAAGIGLGATVMFLILDVTILQPLGTYTNRWHEIGGHSNWWYHPVWWMAGSYLAWLGAFIMANQAAKSGKPSVGGMLGMVAVLTVACGAIAAATGFPGAGWNVPTFAIAVLPALALGTWASSLGAKQG